MMPLPRLDTDAWRLLHKVGRGRGGHVASGGTLALDYRRAGGAGVIVTATLGTAAVRLWIDARAWCCWVEPVLALDDIASVPQDLHAALAAWTVASLDPEHGDAGDCVRAAPPDMPGDWPTGVALEPAALPPTYGWCLSAERDGRRLDALVLDAPLAWLDGLAGRLPAVAPPEAGEEAAASISAAAAPVRASLVAGWTHLPPGVIAGLQIGDALMLQTAFPVTDHLFGLFLTRPLARVRCEAADHIEIDYIMDTFDDWMDVEPGIARNAADINLRDANVSVVAEVGTIDVPLGALAALAVGDVLVGQASAGELVALKIAGRVIARATLLDIDGKLAARIEQI